MRDFKLFSLARLDSIHLKGAFQIFTPSLRTLERVALSFLILRCLRLFIKTDSHTG